MTRLLTKKVSKRATAKKKKIKGDADAKKQTVQDLRVTKVQKDNRGTRAVPQQPLRPEVEKSSDEKAVRALRKKLKEIAALMERQQIGEELDDQQLFKISRLQNLVREMEGFSEATI